MHAAFVNRKCRSAAKNDRFLNHVLQFANIARPVIRLQQFQRLPIDVLDFLPG